MATLNTALGTLTVAGASNLNNAAARNRTVAGAGAGSAVPLVYGSDRIGGLILNVLPAAGSTTLYLVQCLWCFAGDSVNDVSWNDAALTAGSSATHYTGSQTTADADIVAAFAAQGITYADTLAGYMYSVLKLPIREFDGRLQPTARIKGRKLYDPRQDSTAGGSGSQRLATPSTWTWSDCGSLALADFAASALYGLGRTVDWSSVPAAANANDAMIGSPAERSRIVGVSFTTPTAAGDIAEALRTYAGCFLVPSPAGIQLLPDAAASSCATYAHDNGDIAAIGALTRRDNGNLPTAVEVLYTDTTVVPWIEGSALAQVSGAGTTYPWRLTQVRLPGVQRYSQAMREATERLNKMRLGDLSCAVEVFDVGIRHQVGDVVTVSHPVGLTSALMRVGTVSMPGPGRWALQLAQYSAAAYSTAVLSGPAVVNANIVAGANNADVVAAATTALWAGVTGTGKPADYASSGRFLNTDPFCADLTRWSGSPGSFSVATVSDGQIGNSVIRCAAVGGASILSNRLPVNPNKLYRVRATARKSGGTDGTFYLVAAMFDSTDTPIARDGSYWYYPAAGVALNTTWTEYSGLFGVGQGGNAIPTNARTMSVGVFLKYAAASGATYHECQGVILEEIANTEDIAPEGATKAVAVTVASDTCTMPAGTYANGVDAATSTVATATYTNTTGAAVTAQCEVQLTSAYTPGGGYSSGRQVETQLRTSLNAGLQTTDSWYPVNSDNRGIFQQIVVAAGDTVTFQVKSLIHTLGAGTQTAPSAVITITNLLLRMTIIKK